MRGADVTCNSLSSPSSRVPISYTQNKAVTEKYQVRGLEDFVNRGKEDVIREIERVKGVGLT
jgi:hypothetical protein